MRDYLFRGFGNNNEKKWRYGDLRIYKENKASIWENDTGNPVDPKTVGQFTGLHDKNGVKIFEGDIIKAHYANCQKCDHIESIVFFEGKFMAENHFSKTGTSWSPLPSSTRIIEPWWDKTKPVYMESCEVIGNIHDNPELLEAE